MKELHKEWLSLTTHSKDKELIIPLSEVPVVLRVTFCTDYECRRVYDNAVLSSESIQTKQGYGYFDLKKVEAMFPQFAAAKTVAHAKVAAFRRKVKKLAKEFKMSEKELIYKIRITRSRQ
jgi:hypothetical protein